MQGLQHHHAVVFEAYIRIRLQSLDSRLCQGGDQILITESMPYFPDYVLDDIFSRCGLQHFRKSVAIGCGIDRNSFQGETGSAGDTGAGTVAE